MNEKHIERAAKKIKESGKIVVLTGAGISTESGIPDFRSQNGLWNGHDPQVISHHSAVGKPEFHQFFKQRIDDFESHEPNISHSILADWESRGTVSSVITQNIDGYHLRAGTKQLIEMHGHMHYLECDYCRKRYLLSKYDSLNPQDCEHVDPQYNEPCYGTVRPPVVLFGEMLDPMNLHLASQEVAHADLIIVLGTSLEVQPFAGLVEEAYQSGEGASVMIVNRSETPYDYAAAYRFHDNISHVLKAIDERL